MERGSGQGGFRPGEDIVPGEVRPPPPPATLAFTAAANAGGTDFDVLMGYQVFLGRDPESSFVIADAKSSPVGAFIRALMGSGEFQSAVLDRLGPGRRLPHENASAAPSPEQLDWVFRHLRLPAPAQAALRAAADWQAWLRTLTAIPGFPQPPGRAAPAAAPGIEARAADDGFVLVHLEQPKAGERLTPGSVIAGSGWAIAPADLAEITVHLDGTLLTHARYGLPRPDVARSFPHYRHVDHCGFTFSAELPRQLGPGAPGELVVSARTVRGEAGRKAVRLQPPTDRTNSSAPETGQDLAGAPDTWPIRLNVDEASVDADRTLRLRGWAASLAPLRALTAVFGETGAEVLGGVQHGLPRPDIARAHPGYGNAGLSGFALAHRLPPDVPPGPTFIRVRAEDALGRTRQAIHPITVPAPSAEAAAEWATQAGLPCACDLATLSAGGMLTVGGWAIDPAGAEPVQIAIELDGRPLGTALTGRPRPDVAEMHSTAPAAAFSGFSFSCPVGELSQAAPRRLVVRVTASEGERILTRTLGGGHRAEASPPLADPPAADPRHADLRVEVDQPPLDGDVALAPIRGALTISGWTVARPGVAQIDMFCGADRLGHAHLGMRREDIGAAFGDYEGALLSGYALVLPPGTLPPGTHRIRIVATARAPSGTPATMERCFTVQVEQTDALPPGCEVRSRIPPAEAAFGLNQLAQQGTAPAFDIAILGATPALSAELAVTLASLEAQIHPAWRATVRFASKAAAADPALSALLASVPGRRVSAAWPGKASAPATRSKATPQRLAMRLRPGDRLAADALLTLAAAQAASHEEFVYADDLRPDPSTGIRAPCLKPDWSPELLLATNYVGRSWCATTALMERAGVPPDASDYEAVLCLTAQAAGIGHVQRVLCEAAPAIDPPEAEAAALAASLARSGVSAQVGPGAAPGTWRVRRTLARPRRRRSARGRVAGRVSIVMPTCGAGGLVRIAIQTIRATTERARAAGWETELVVLDNSPASDARTKAWLRRNADIVVDLPGAFNWSRFNNEGARAATGQVLLFLNDDIEIRQPDWLEAMLEHALRPGVGVVGARLLYPDGKVQHGGQYLAHGHARHAFRFAEGAAPGPFGLAQVAREMISVTGACQMVRADVFERLGGFEEAHSVVNNDLDFCLKSWRAGLAVVFTPHATLIHHELASRAAIADSYDEARFAGAWRDRFLRGDPFRNRRLAPDSDHYGVDPEPTAELHVGRRGPEAAQVRRILAVKLDHIGDFLTALPALRSLAARFPAATIDLLAPAATAELARHEPVISNIHVFEFFHARSGDGRKGLGEAEFQALQARLVPCGYDMAIDLRMQPETRTVLPYAGAAFLAGYDHDGRFPFLDVALEWEGDQRLLAKRAHVSERLVQLVSAASDACQAEPPAAGQARPLAPPLAPRLASGNVAALAGLPAGFLARPLVCIHPGVGNAVRQWPARHYAALIDLLAAEGLHAVLIGGPDEAAIADEVLRGVVTPGAAESVVGQVRLARLPELMRACVLFVGNNSGPQHLAASLGLPTIGIHSGVVDAAEWAPLGARAMALRRVMVCGPCYLEFAADCPRALACLTGLRPAEVFERCRLLLATIQI